jgi:hypothetical protein
VPADVRHVSTGFSDIATITFDDLAQGTHPFVSHDLSHISWPQAQQNGHSAVGKHVHRFDMCRSGASHAASHGIHGFHSVSYGDVVSPGPRAVGNCYDPAESLLTH